MQEETYDAKEREQQQEDRAREVATAVRRRESKIKEEKNLRTLQSRVWWAVEDKGTHLRRCYVSGGKRHIKRASNKKVRQTKGIGQGAGYRRVYDYWWELF